MAASTIYTSQGAFLANAGTIDRSENFENTGRPLGQNLGVLITPFGQFRNPVTGSVALVPPTQSNFDLGGAPVGSIVLTANGEDDFNVLLSTPLYSLGFEAFTNDYGPTYIRFLNGSTVLRTVYIGPDGSKGNNRRFVGITSDVAITSFLFDSYRGDVRNAGIDNLIGSTVNPVPEASTWAMLIMGLGFAGAALRKGKRRGAAAFA